MTYDAAYFIAKFEAIPDELWFVGKLTDPENQARHCALGHCVRRDFIFNHEAEALFRILNFPANINDGDDPRYPRDKFPTPKARILAALRDVVASYPASP